MEVDTLTSKKDCPPSSVSSALPLAEANSKKKTLPPLFIKRGKLKKKKGDNLLQMTVLLCCDPYFLS